MRLRFLLSCSLLVSVCPLFAQTGPMPNGALLDGRYDRASGQAVDEAYSAKIREYKTDPRFGSSLVNTLPASKTVPTLAKVMGDVAGAPNMLPYAEDVAKYFRLLAASSSRVKVISIGRMEEGREMIAAAIGNESLLRDADSTRSGWRTLRTRVPWASTTARQRR